MFFILSALLSFILLIFAIFSFINLIPDFSAGLFTSFFAGLFTGLFVIAI